MLRELLNTRQIHGESPRRWFSSAKMDLIIWFDHDGNPDHFELCFDKSTQEQCLRWSRNGHTHFLVDSGEDIPGRYKATPIHRVSAKLDSKRLLESFLAESTFMPLLLSSFVSDALNQVIR